MSAYRVAVRMLPAAAFPVTVRTQQVPNYYEGDVVTGADPADIERLVADGFLEVVDDAEQPVS